MYALIFTNGDLHLADWVRPYFRQAAVIIAADGGANHILALGRQPDVIIGDLDSLAPELHERLARAGARIHRSPAAKDETDLELALLYAAANYEEPILVFGALGGRLDQMFANILLLMHPQLRGRDISFQTEYQRIWLVEKQATITGEPGDTVSLIPLSGDVDVQSTTGLRWPLADERLVFGPARGVSNEMISDVAHVSIREGHLLCVHTQRGWRR